ncbi:MAG TPA: gluconate 2-dehydrogenase subunit 3 family protein [Polyangiaceae bacterium]|nr:gluconate 2-dehydrogenase subunit 3 family protein [Polyangiaceae bacterium]
MSRRDALGTSAGIVMGAALQAALAGCRADPPSASASEPAPAAPAEPAPPEPAATEPGSFSRAQRAIIDEVADVLIPETDSPGARRAEVPAYIEGVVFAVLEDDDRRALCEGLDAIDAAARQKHGQPFAACPPEAKSALVNALFASGGTPAPNERELAFRRRLRELTITGFCKSRFGATRVLQYDPIPGAYDGCRTLESVGRAWATS